MLSAGAPRGVAPPARAFPVTLDLDCSWSGAPRTFRSPSGLRTGTLVLRYRPRLRSACGNGPWVRPGWEVGVESSGREQSKRLGSTL